MNEVKLGAVESRFADLIWDNEPISSGELVRKAEEVLSWKKSTTYTILKRLCERGIFQNDHGTVASLISKDTFGSIQSEKIIDENFNGSLPAFVAAFAKRRNLSEEEITELKELIEKMGG